MRLDYQALMNYNLSAEQSMIFFRIILRLFLGLTLVPAVMALLATMEELQLHWYNAHPPILHTEEGPMVVTYEVTNLLPVWADLTIVVVALLYTLFALRWIFKRRKSRSLRSR